MPQCLKNKYSQTIMGQPRPNDIGENNCMVDGITEIATYTTLTKNYRISTFRWCLLVHK